MEHEHEALELDPFTIAADLDLKSDDEEKQMFVERGGNCNTARGQSGTRWS